MEVAGETSSPCTAGTFRVVSVADVWQRAELRAGGNGSDAPPGRVIKMRAVLVDGCRPGGARGSLAVEYDDAAEAPPLAVGDMVRVGVFATKADGVGVAR